MIDVTLHKIILIKSKSNKEMTKNCSKPALFLDRDGVILKECDHLSDPKKVYLEEGVKSFTEFISSKNIPIVIVTNQSGIFRGDYHWEDYELVTRRMLKLLGNKVKIHAIYANSEDRNIKKTLWRKPSPNMILLAQKELHIDLFNSVLIGDRNSDLQAGLNANIKNLIHVKTGHGESERETIKKNIQENFFRKENKKNFNFQLIESFDKINFKNFHKSFFEKGSLKS